MNYRRLRGGLRALHCRELTNGGLAKGGLAIWIVFNTLIAKPPFTEPPFVNSRGKQDLSHGLDGKQKRNYGARAQFQESSRLTPKKQLSWTPDWRL